MKKPTTVLLVAAALTLSGCAAEGTTIGTYNPETHYVFQQEVEPGRFVTCVWAKSGYGGGMSCDWVGYHLEEPSSSGEQS
jgi:type IV pilus biogenesis protein CpaD/CtpE